MRLNIIATSLIIILIAKSRVLLLVLLFKIFTSISERPLLPVKGYHTAGALLAARHTAMRRATKIRRELGRLGCGQDLMTLKIMPRWLADDIAISIYQKKSRAHE